MSYKINGLSAGKSQTLALLASGEVLGWGGAGSGRFTPDNMDICSPLNANIGPVYVGQSAIFSTVSAGYGTSLGVSDRQELLIWGFSSMGMPSGQAISEIPTLIKHITSPTVVTAGQSFYAAIDRLGGLHTWGLNVDGVLGRETKNLNALPDKVEGLPPAQNVAVGDNFMTVLSRQGEVFSFGSNSAGQLGLGHLNSISAPQLVKLPNSVQRLAVGATHVLALDIDGNVMAWGSNQYGQLGHDQRRYSETPMAIQMPEKITALAAGSHFSMALSVTGSVYAWGWNGFGQLGLNDYVHRAMPTRIPALSGIQALAAGEMHALAIGKNYLYGWGSNESGQIGPAGRKQWAPYPLWPLG